MHRTFMLGVILFFTGSLALPPKIDQFLYYENTNEPIPDQPTSYDINDIPNYGMGQDVYAEDGAIRNKLYPTARFLKPQLEACVLCTGDIKFILNRNIYEIDIVTIYRLLLAQSRKTNGLDLKSIVQLVKDGKPIALSLTTILEDFVIIIKKTHPNIPAQEMSFLTDGSLQGLNENEVIKIVFIILTWDEILEDGHDISIEIDGKMWRLSKINLSRLIRLYLLVTHRNLALDLEITVSIRVSGKVIDIPLRRLHKIFYTKLIEKYRNTNMDLTIFNIFINEELQGLNVIEINTRTQAIFIEAFTEDGRFEIEIDGEYEEARGLNHLYRFIYEHIHDIPGGIGFDKPVSVRINVKKQFPLVEVLEHLLLIVEGFYATYPQFDVKLFRFFTPENLLTLTSDEIINGLKYHVDEIEMILEIKMDNIEKVAEEITIEVPLNSAETSKNETNKEDTIDNSEEDTKGDSKENTKDDSEEDTKDDSEEDTKDDSEEDSKDDSEEGTKDELVIEKDGYRKMLKKLEITEPELNQLFSEIFTQYPNTKDDIAKEEATTSEELLYNSKNTNDTESKIEIKDDENNKIDDETRALEDKDEAERVGITSGELLYYSKNTNKDESEMTNEDDSNNKINDETRSLEDDLAEEAASQLLYYSKNTNNDESQMKNKDDSNNKIHDETRALEDDLSEERETTSSELFYYSKNTTNDESQMESKDDLNKEIAALEYVIAEEAPNKDGSEMTNKDDSNNKINDETLALEDDLSEEAATSSELLYYSPNTNNDESQMEAEEAATTPGELLYYSKNTNIDESQMANRDDSNNKILDETRALEDDMAEERETTSGELLYYSPNTNKDESEMKSNDDPNEIDDETTSEPFIQTAKMVIVEEEVESLPNSAPYSDVNDVDILEIDIVKEDEDLRKDNPESPKKTLLVPSKYDEDYETYEQALQPKMEDVLYSDVNNIDVFKINIVKEDTNVQVNYPEPSPEEEIVLQAFYPYIKPISSLPNAYEEDKIYEYSLNDQMESKAELDIIDDTALEYDIAEDEGLLQANYPEVPEMFKDITESRGSYMGVKEFEKQYLEALYPYVKPISSLPNPYDEDDIYEHLLNVKMESEGVPLNDIIDDTRALEYDIEEDEGILQANYPEAHSMVKDITESLGSYMDEKKFEKQYLEALYPYVKPISSFPNAYDEDEIYEHSLNDQMESEAKLNDIIDYTRALEDDIAADEGLLQENYQQAHSMVKDITKSLGSHMDENELEKLYPESLHPNVKIFSNLPNAYEHSLNDQLESEAKLNDIIDYTRALEDDIAADEGLLQENYQETHSMVKDITKSIGSYMDENELEKVYHESLHPYVKIISNLPNAYEHSLNDQLESKAKLNDIIDYTRALEDDIAADEGLLQENYQEAHSMVKDITKSIGSYMDENELEKVYHESLHPYVKIISGLPNAYDEDEIYENSLNGQMESEAKLNDIIDYTRALEDDIAADEGLLQENYQEAHSMVKDFTESLGSYMDKNELEKVYHESLHPYVKIISSLPNAYDEDEIYEHSLNDQMESEVKLIDIIDYTRALEDDIAADEGLLQENYQEAHSMVKEITKSLGSYMDENELEKVYPESLHPYVKIISSLPNAYDEDEIYEHSLESEAKFNDIIDYTRALEDDIAADEGLLQENYQEAHSMVKDITESLGYYMDENELEKVYHESLHPYVKIISSLPNAYDEDEIYEHSLESEAKFNDIIDYTRALEDDIAADEGLLQKNYQEAPAMVKDITESLGSYMDEYELEKLYLEALYPYAKPISSLPSAYDEDKIYEHSLNDQMKKENVPCHDIAKKEYLYSDVAEEELVQITPTIFKVNEDVMLINPQKKTDNTYGSGVLDNGITNIGCSDRIIYYQVTLPNGSCKQMALDELINRINIDKNARNTPVIIVNENESCTRQIKNFAKTLQKVRLAQELETIFEEEEDETVRNAFEIVRLRLLGKNNIRVYNNENTKQQPWFCRIHCH
ncbi:unnamed protein product [Brassicogethes aeneus]|uniref:Uncharacterized protein n=1 Tax=Brassicogethes aeneus TaxID=1431903 RepID=A0A9P0FQX6_BRAAE|nr:unnamed protein product [Brassicogethes aeneus]